MNIILKLFEEISQAPGNLKLRILLLDSLADYYDPFPVPEIEAFYQQIRTRLATPNDKGEALAIIYYSRSGYQDGTDAKINALIKQYKDPDQIIADIRRFADWDRMFNKKGYSRNVGTFMYKVGKESPLDLIQLLEKLSEADPKIALTEGHDWLARLKFHRTGNELYFQEKMRFLLNIGSRDSLNFILNTYYYGIYETDCEHLDEFDLDLLNRIFVEVIDYPNSEDSESVEYAIRQRFSDLLPWLVEHRRERFLPLLIRFFEKTSNDQIDRTLIHFCKPGKEFEEELLEKLLFEHTPNLSLYHCEYHLPRILDHFYRSRGIEWLFNYFELKLKARKKRGVEYENVFSGMLGTRGYPEDCPKFLNEPNEVERLWTHAVNWFFSQAFIDNTITIADGLHLVRCFIPKEKSIVAPSKIVVDQIGQTPSYFQLFLAVLLLVFLRSSEEAEIIADKIENEMDRQDLGRYKGDWAGKFEMSRKSDLDKRIIQLFLRFTEDPQIDNDPHLEVMIKDIRYQELGLWPRNLLG